MTGVVGAEFWLQVMVTEPLEPSLAGVPLEPPAPTTIEIVEPAENADDVYAFIARPPLPPALPQYSAAPPLAPPPVVFVSPPLAVPGVPGGREHHS